jgi:flagellar basal-body rod modification protein FlgD
MSIVEYNSTIQNALDLTSTASTAEASKVDKQLGKEDFLKLLVAQMQYQDPLNPMEGIEFTSSWPNSPPWNSYIT